jgi:hypothetical protein
MPRRTAARAAASGYRQKQRPYFAAADWYWNPIKSSPVLDTDSATIVANLATGEHSATIVEFGATLVPPSSITAATPRYDVNFRRAPGGDLPQWGPDPFGTDTCPYPAGTTPPTGSDKHVALADPTANAVYSMWRTTFSGSVLGAEWGAKVRLDGDGRETGSASSTGSQLSRYAGIVTGAEITAGVIDHAIYFASSFVRPTEFRYPANKTDGSNLAGGAANGTIPEGCRVQLDPTINVAAIAGITAAEVTIARCLQTYGAYCCDNGGSVFSIGFQYLGSTVSSVYTSKGLAWDYYDMNKIPWSSLRVLRRWDGG